MICEKCGKIEKEVFGEWRTIKIFYLGSERDYRLWLCGTCDSDYESSVFDDNYSFVTSIKQLLFPCKKDCRNWQKCSYCFRYRKLGDLYAPMIKCTVCGKTHDNDGNDWCKDCAEIWWQDWKERQKRGVSRK